MLNRLQKHGRGRSTPTVSPDTGRNDNRGQKGRVRAAQDPAASEGGKAGGVAGVGKGVVAGDGRQEPPGGEGGANNKSLAKKN